MKKFAVIFDMDGVMVDTNPYHKAAIQQFCQKYHRLLDEQEMRRRIYGRTNKEWIMELFDHQLDYEQMRAYAEEKEALFRELYRPYIQPVKGLLGFLQQLDTHRISRAIGTSAPRVNVDFVLTNTATEAYFQTILDESHVNFGKPHPEIYLKAAEALGFAPENCIVIEDSLSGVASGKASGAKVVGITTTHTAEELQAADRVIADFDQISTEILQTWFFS
jgi:HAD superfamily hydrolase (TIGR01509 family)